MEFTKENFLKFLGPAETNKVVKRLHGLSYVPEVRLEELAGHALTENWGEQHYVLEKYLAIHVAWSIEQGRFTKGKDQIYVTAGNLQSRYGTPLYLVFNKNFADARQPLCLVYCGADVSAPKLPVPPDIPTPPDIPRGAEIVMLHEHILKDRADRVPFLSETPPVAQMCAVSGAIQWSLNRGLQIPYWYFGRMNYIVPLYLQSREDISREPDVIAPIEVTEELLLVRTVLPPHGPYPNARASVKRHDQLPHWMLDAWNTYGHATAAEDTDDSE